LARALALIESGLPNDTIPENRLGQGFLTFSISLELKASAGKPWLFLNGYLSTSGCVLAGPFLGFPGSSAINNVFSLKPAHLAAPTGGPDRVLH